MTLQKPTKAYGIYYWDTFERPGEDTYLIGEADTWDEALAFVDGQEKLERPAFRLKADGADRVEIVHFVAGSGTVMQTYRVG